jgi:hypothetical protein
MSSKASSWLVRQKWGLLYKHIYQPTETEGCEQSRQVRRPGETNKADLQIFTQAGGGQTKQSKDRHSLSRVVERELLVCSFDPAISLSLCRYSSLLVELHVAVLKYVLHTTNYVVCV